MDSPLPEKQNICRKCNENNDPRKIGKFLMVKVSEDVTKKPLFVVIYPYKFTDFVYDLIELNYFKRYCDVLVLDISPITTPSFSKGVSAERSKKSNVIIVSSWLDFVRCVYELRKRSTETNICILNEVTYSSVSEFLCNLGITALLKRRSVTIFDLYNGGIPIHFPGAASKPKEITQHSKFIAKALRFAKNTTTLSEAKKKISSVLFSSLARLMPSATTHRLVAGEDWLAFARGSGQERNRIRLVYGHSHDYSNYLQHKVKSSSFALPHKKIAVLLDDGMPMFGTDYIHLGRKVYTTIDVWYPALTLFFDRIEVETGVQIEIAGHYKSTHQAIEPCFGNRSVHYGKTMELVRNSEFVITQYSTAISYAVMFRKPVIFIYSNQLKEDNMAMRYIRGMAAMLGKEPVNIDELPIDIRGLLKVNEERYLNYEKTCLTSFGSQRPNVQIILEDIMNINTGSDFTKTNPTWTIK